MFHPGNGHGVHYVLAFTRQRALWHRARSTPTEASSRSDTPGSKRPPRSAVHTLQRTLLASSRTASLRPLPSCCCTASSCDHTPLPKQLRMRPATMDEAGSAHSLRDNTHGKPCLDLPHSPDDEPRYRSDLQARRPSHRGVRLPAHTADKRQHGHPSEEACGVKRWSTTH